MSQGPIRLMVLAPPLSCWGLERLVASVGPPFELAGSATSMEPLQRACEAGGADVLVVDLDLDVDKAAVEALAKRTHMRVVLIVPARDEGLLDQAVLSGVRGIVRRQDPPQVLLQAIEKVAQGELWLDRSAATRIFLELVQRKSGAQEDPALARIRTLTEREREMIRAVTRDTRSPGKVIASRLCISQHTLRNHLSSIYSKLGLSNRLDLYAFASRHQLDRLDSRILSTDRPSGSIAWGTNSGDGVVELPVQARVGACGGDDLVETHSPRKAVGTAAKTAPRYPASGDIPLPPSAVNARFMPHRGV